MDDISKKINKSREDKKNFDNFELKSKQNFESIDTSMYDETLKEIDYILNNLEQKSNIEENQLKKLDVLPEIKTVISKIHLAKNEIVKEENNLIKNNNLIRRIENLEKNTQNLNEPVLLSDESINDDKEHKIDGNILSFEETDVLVKNDKKKKKSSFGFYSYLVSIIIIILVVYGTLNISKNLIIKKFPTTELYIQYFFEIIEIVKIIVFSIGDSIKSLI